MSLYPSLEDMKVGQMIQAQQPASHPTNPGNNEYPFSQQQALPYPTMPGRGGMPVAQHQLHVYPTLDDYMGLSLTSDELAILRDNGALAVPQSNTVSTVHSGDSQLIAPVSGSSLGLKRAQVTHGVRELTLCKDKEGKVGMRVQAINKGVFVVFVYANSPASLVGLRFGDQILQINDDNVAGFSMDKVHSIIKKSALNGIKLVVRDRPFERTITLHKDSTGHTGFAFKSGQINAIVKDSSAARNGLLTEHNMLEVNGQNVVGMDDKHIRNIIESGGNVITLTIMPSIIYDHMMKKTSSSLVKKFMDHSIPDI